MKFLAGLSLLVIVSVGIVEAQNPVVSPTPPAIEDCGLKDSEPMTLNVSVWSKNKGYLKDLTYKDFEVFDGKTKQSIECFKQSDEPVSVGILFDLSASMKPVGNSKISEIPFAVEGLISFINAANSKNEYFIIGFAKETPIFLDPTQDKKQIEGALKKLVDIKPEGLTRMYDAMEIGFEKLLSGKFDKKVLLVVSDGADTNSKKFDFADIKRQTRENPNVMLYQVNIVTDEYELTIEQREESTQKLRSLVENSGGLVFYPRSRAQVVEAFEALADDLKNQYQIGFKPQSESNAKKNWHEVKVSLNLPKERKEEAGKITIRAQRGFYF